MFARPATCCRKSLPPLLAAALIVAGCAEQRHYPIAQPFIVSEATWGPFIDGLALANVAGTTQPEVDYLPRVLNIGDAPFLTGGCTTNPPLPPGINFFTFGNTCALTGRPDLSQLEAAERAQALEGREYTITVSNVAGSDEAKVFLAISESPPIFVDLSEDRTFAGYLEIRNLTLRGVSDCALAIDSPPLPSGVAIGTEVSVRELDSATASAPNACALLGAPALGTVSESVKYRFVARNSLGETKFEAQITFAVLVPDISLPSDVVTSFRVGDTVNLPFSNVGSPIETCLNSLPLPLGLSLSLDPATSSCLISGMPTTVTASTTYAIEARNPAGSDTLFLVLEVVE